MYPPKPPLIIATTPASKPENTPEWKAETTLIFVVESGPWEFFQPWVHVWGMPNRKNARDNIQHSSKVA